MKIQTTTGAEPTLRAKSDNIQMPVKDGSVHFRRTLTTLSGEAHMARLQEMRLRIDRQAERLSDRVDVKELELYRKMIREFLDEIVSNGYNFSREDAYASRGRHRFIATVQIIDQRLHDLGKEVMKEHADKIEVLSMLDDIRGLLLDLMQ